MLAIALCALKMHIRASANATPSVGRNVNDVREANMLLFIREYTSKFIAATPSVNVPCSYCITRPGDPFFNQLPNLLALKTVQKIGAPFLSGTLTAGLKV